MMYKLLRAVSLTVLVGAGAVRAEIMLDRSIVDFKAGEPPRQDIVVSNLSDETAYVKVEILEVLKPGSPDEERRAVTNLDDIQFVASPAKLAIPAKGRKQVRLVNLAPPGEEKVYRINFTPVLPPLAPEEGVGVRIIVSYQVLALIHPAEPREDLRVHREGKTLHFSNAGNSYALISDVKQCDRSGEGCREDIGGIRLYGGNDYTLELPYADTPVSYRLTNFKGARLETVD